MRVRTTLLTATFLALVASCTGSEQRPSGETGARADAAAASNAACDGYRQCIAAAEPPALAQRTDVRRDSLRLIFSIANRSPVELVNGDPAHEDSHYYLYNGWDEALGAHRVYLMEYESSAVLYVFPNSGAVSGLDELPVISPSGRFAATASWDTEAQMSFNRARIFRVLRDSLVLEWEIAPKLWGPDSLKWLDDSTLIVRRGPALWHPDSASIRDPVTVRRTNGAWRADSSARAP